MKKDFYQVSLKLILENNKREILILKGHPNGCFSGFYDLPGGRIDDDEFNGSFEEIIRREIKEELGNIEALINPNPVTAGRHLIKSKNNGSKKDIKILYLFFKAKFISGEISNSKEHGGFKWVNLSEIQPEKFFKSGILEGIRNLNKE